MPDITDTTTTTTTTEGDTMPDTTTTTTTPALLSLELATVTAGTHGVVRYTYYGDTDYLVATIADDRQSCQLVELGAARPTLHAMRFEYATEPRWTVQAVGSMVDRASVALRASEPVTMAPGSMVPTTADEGERMARALLSLASWADGGERHRAAQDIAENHPEGELCGSYEALVCPTFGWAPRRSEERWAPHRATFTDRMASWERDHGHLSVVDRLERRARLYDRGGVMNQAAVDHISNHLESHKIDAVNDLLEKIGWDTVAVEREYDITVTVTRTRTVTETAMVTLTRMASDEDSARDMVDSYDVNDAAENRWLDWSEHDEETEIQDWDIDEVELS